MPMAAEMTGRVCLAFDIDSAYIDAVVLRWQNFTDLTATLRSHVSWRDQASDQVVGFLFLHFSEIVENMSASYFGIVLGLAGLGSAWRGAERAWQLPKFIAGWIYVVAGVVWAALVVL